MKNFVYGLIVGLLIAAVFLVGSEYGCTSAKTGLVEFSDENDWKQPPKQQDVSLKATTFSTSSIAKVQKKPVVKLISSQEVPNNSDFLDNEEGKQKIIQMLDNFNANDLVRIESILKHLNDKTLGEQFVSESIDANWSLKKQAELEYTFYEQSALKDVGNLKSIQCKSQTCQVRVQVPMDLELKPSHYLDWSNPMSVSIKPDQHDSDFRTIEIYISRE